jgi:hypothetical protein
MRGRTSERSIYLVFRGNVQLEEVRKNRVSPYNNKHFISISAVPGTSIKNIITRTQTRGGRWGGGGVWRNQRELPSKSARSRPRTHSRNSPKIKKGWAGGSRFGPSSSSYWTNSFGRARIRGCVCVCAARLVNYH